jgi:integrase
VGRRLERLSAKGVQAKRKAGYYADGGGLYLQVSEAETKSWIFRYTLAGRSREMGLGPLHTISLAEARVRATACRQLLLDGVDPIEARDAKKRAIQLDTARAKTFSECATAYIKAHGPKWRNAKHAAQWQSTLDTYAGPVFGRLNVQDVDTALVLKVLEPIWTEKPETASRLRGRIEAVLDWATVRGFRTGDNPARWKGQMQALLPSVPKQLRVKHHAALPFDEMGAFMTALRRQEGIAARALEFAILTATRTGEVIGATWDEIDLDDAVWVIPATRMKALREHRVPLSGPALAVLRALRDVRDGKYVFPGQKQGKPISNMAMLELLKRMGVAVTSHGFRSSFKDWSSERTSYPREVTEMALAHTVGDKVEAAYRRGDLFEKRKRLMTEWAKHCERPKVAKVVHIA